MGEDTFRRIVAVENEISARLAEERRQVDNWLEGVKAELHREYRDRLKELKAEVGRTVQSREAQRQKDEQRLLKRAKVRAKALAAIEDKELKKILIKYLSAILPGE